MLLTVFLTITACISSTSSGCATNVASDIEPTHFVETRPTPTPPAKPDKSVTIAAVGDIMLGSPFPRDDRMPPNDGADILKAMTPILSAADITFGNLEGPMTDGGISEKCKPPKPGQPVRCFAFRMPTRYGKYLKDAGFDVMSLANNHALDFGFDGTADTRKTLELLGIKHAGSDKQTYSTAIVEVNGKRVAFIGFAHNTVVPNVNDIVNAARLVAEANKKADIVVVSFHGGAEGAAAQNVPDRTELYFGEKRGNLPLFARTVIDAGADLVIGHGPHVLRGMDVYKGRLIAYSLGNFATYGWFKLQDETALTVVLEAKLDSDGKLIGGKLHAAKQVDWGVPVPDDEGNAIRKIRSLSNADFPTTAPVINDDGSFLPRK